jgi:hypothetical protein
LNPTDPPSVPASSLPDATESRRRRARDFLGRPWRKLRGKRPAKPFVPPTEDQLRQARRVRIGAGIIMALLAAGAAVVSYNDGLFLVRLAGIHDRVAYLYPLLPDGLIIISWASIYESGLAGHRSRPAWANAGIALGACLTLAMNIGAGVLHNRLQAGVDGVVPVVLFVALEILVGLIRRGHGAAAEPGGNDGLVCLHSVAGTLDGAVRAAWAHDIECNGFKPTFVDFEARFGIPRKRVAELVRGPVQEVPVPSMNGSGAGA